ncbi:MAG TPA: phage holin family protein [Acetobacteraceae bacterium]|jgi:chromate transport protein ChrA|nr:phage holin family protein [Acetobacteraceae bacterium]
MLLRRLGLAIAAGVVAVIGAAFLVAACYLWLASVLPRAAAAGVTGGVLVAIALLLLVAGARRGRREPLGPEELVFAALRLVARSVQAAPEKALIAALVAGVLSEWFGGQKVRRDRGGPGGEPGGG